MLCYKLNKNSYYKTTFKKIYIFEMFKTLIQMEYFVEQAYLGTSPGSCPGAQPAGVAPGGPVGTRPGPPGAGADPSGPVGTSNLYGR